ncbi:MAG: PIN domain-containing protein [Thermoanaerobaculia bacterium]
MPDDEPSSILDASALIAFLHDEPGSNAVLDAITATAAVSVVNWAEALSKVAADGHDPQRVADSFQASDSPLHLQQLTDGDCVEIARLRPLTKARGLSLADPCSRFGAAGCRFTRRLPRSRRRGRRIRRRSLSGRRRRRRAPGWRGC